MQWFLSITRRWMTPRGVTEAAQYTPAAPTMTQFAQGVAAVIRTTHEEPVREIAQGVLFGTQFQHFIPEVAAGSSSPAREVHLEEMDLSYTADDAGPSQPTQPSQSSHYQTPPRPDLNPNDSYYRRRRRRPTQLDRIDESS
ncbi:unnamed protein product [Amaranthus hypochondriacus]